jgi:hypothetical protein
MGGGNTLPKGLPGSGKTRSVPEGSADDRNVSNGGLRRSEPARECSDKVSVPTFRKNRGIPARIGIPDDSGKAALLPCAKTGDTVHILIEEARKAGKKRWIVSTRGSSTPTVGKATP